MRSARCCLVPAVLLAGLACQPRVATPVVYGPWVEGLTLAFADPSQSQRLEDRMQVRVAHSTMAPSGPGLVKLDVSSSRSHLTVLVRHHDGGLDLVEESGRVLARLLPANFPGTPRWVDRGTEFTVVGRALWDGAALLPATSDPVGIWVEAKPQQGSKRRTLYLPNLGEVETREERNGSWVVVNRLVSYGFTDPPAYKRP